MTLYDKLSADTRDAILCEAAAFSTMPEGMDHSAEKLRKKAAQFRSGARVGNRHIITNPHSPHFATNSQRAASFRGKVCSR